MSNWKDLPPIAKFSVIAFVIALILGLISLGAEGLGIYYAVGFALPVSIETIQGDAVWPSIILAGMVWSPAFLFAGWICQRINNKVLLWITYLLILWTWDYLVWWAIVTLNFLQ
jgi:hypothetical protein